jgi:hypothetical protein
MLCMFLTHGRRFSPVKVFSSGIQAIQFFSMQALMIIKRVIKGSDLHWTASSEILTGEDPCP